LKSGSWANFWRQMTSKVSASNLKIIPSGILDDESWAELCDDMDFHQIWTSTHHERRKICLVDTTFSAFIGCCTSFLFWCP
jgi:hypothetical protein